MHLTFRPSSVQCGFNKGNEMDENEWAMIAAIVLGAFLGAVLAVLLMLYRSF